MTACLNPVWPAKRARGRPVRRCVPFGTDENGGGSVQANCLNGRKLLPPTRYARANPRVWRQTAAEATANRVFCAPRHGTSNRLPVSAPPIPGGGVVFLARSPAEISPSCRTVWLCRGGPAPSTSFDPSCSTGGGHVVGRRFRIASESVAPCRFAQSLKGPATNRPGQPTRKLCRQPGFETPSTTWHHTHEVFRLLDFAGRSERYEEGHSQDHRPNPSNDISAITTHFQRVSIPRDAATEPHGAQRGTRIRTIDLERRTFRLETADTRGGQCRNVEHEVGHRRARAYPRHPHGQKTWFRDDHAPPTTFRPTRRKRGRLQPPPVPDGEAPMTIATKCTSTLDDEIGPMGIVLNRRSCWRSGLEGRRRQRSLVPNPRMVDSRARTKWFDGPDPHCAPEDDFGRQRDRHPAIANGPPDIMQHDESDCAETAQDGHDEIQPEVRAVTNRGCC